MKSIKLTVIVGKMASGKTVIADGIDAMLTKRGIQVVRFDDATKGIEKRIMKMIDSTKNEKQVVIIYECRNEPESSKFCGYINNFVRCWKFS